MNKNKYSILKIAIILYFLISLIIIAFLPAQVPVHYNLAGLADRTGSKFELLLLPIVGFFWGAFFILMAHSQNKRNEFVNEKILLITGILLVILQFSLSLPVFVKAAHFNISIDMLKLAAIGIGVMMCILGIIMPKTKRNSIIGLRTKWSLQSDAIWYKSQRFGGKLFFVFGLLEVFISGFYSGINCIYVSVVILLLVMIISIYFTYKVAKADS